jgi:hypothetical protein
LEKTTDKLYDIMLYRVNLDMRLTWTHNFNGDCIGRCKANYHTITTAPTIFRYMIIHGRSKWKQNKNKRNKKHSNFLCSMLTNLFSTWVSMSWHAVKIIFKNQIWISKCLFDQVCKIWYSQSNRKCLASLY